MHYYVETNALICLIKSLTRQIWEDSFHISCYQKLCHFATAIFATVHRNFSNNNLDFTSIFLEPAVTSHLQQVNREATYSCCELEFQFLIIPTHSRLPARSMRSTFYVPNPPSLLGYDIRKISEL
jgi:hypothetical protein